MRLTHEFTRDGYADTVTSYGDSALPKTKLCIMNSLYPRRACPACGKSVRKLHRDADGAEIAAIAFMELPFWILFGACAAIGMVHWLAGVTSAVVLVGAFLLWDRSKSRYECDACGIQSSYHQVVESARHDA